PLGFEENELFTLAGYLSSPPSSTYENITSYSNGQLDPYVARVLGQESVEIQRATIDVLNMLKSISVSVNKNAS
ncbi:MAG: XRE family transcriptional regulator, partial [Dehalococcoidales bacterium]|nr:XRE family transcriptional regulator [Dehalococcoidales bacterium]